jgi:hypothetical protein
VLSEVCLTKAQGTRFEPRRDDLYGPMCVEIFRGTTTGRCGTPTRQRATITTTTVHAADAESVCWINCVYGRISDDDDDVDDDDFFNGWEWESDRFLL